MIIFAVLQISKLVKVHISYRFEERGKAYKIYAEIVMKNDTISRNEYAKYMLKSIKTELPYEKSHAEDFHCRLSDSDMVSRLLKSSTKYVSTFYSKEEMDKYIHTALYRNVMNIADWKLKSEQDFKKQIGTVYKDYNEAHEAYIKHFFVIPNIYPATIGRGFNSKLEEIMSSDIAVVLRRDKSELGFHIMTAYANIEPMTNYRIPNNIGFSSSVFKTGFNYSAVDVLKHPDMWQDGSSFDPITMGLYIELRKSKDWDVSHRFDGKTEYIQCNKVNERTGETISLYYEDNGYLSVKRFTNPEIKGGVYSFLYNPNTSMSDKEIRTMMNVFKNQYKYEFAFFEQARNIIDSLSRQKDEVTNNVSTYRTKGNPPRTFFIREERRNHNDVYVSSFNLSGKDKLLKGLLKNPGAESAVSLVTVSSSNRDGGLTYIKLNKDLGIDIHDLMQSAGFNKEDNGRTVDTSYYIKDIGIDNVAVVENSAITNEVEDKLRAVLESYEKYGIIGKQPIKETEYTVIFDMTDSPNQWHGNTSDKLFSISSFFNVSGNTAMRIELNDEALQHNLRAADIMEHFIKVYTDKNSTDLSNVEIPHVYEICYDSCGISDNINGYMNRLASFAEKAYEIAVETGQNPFTLDNIDDIIQYKINVDVIRTNGIAIDEKMLEDFGIPSTEYERIYENAVHWIASGLVENTYDSIMNKVIDEYVDNLENDYYNEQEYSEDLDYETEEYEMV